MDEAAKNALINESRRLILEELAVHGTWEQWFVEMQDFRDKLSAYLYSDSWGGGIAGTSQQIDHHVFGYYAPLDLKGLGFDDRTMVHFEQIIQLSRDFAQNGTDFVYLALPCKKAIYPEWIAGEGADGLSVIPQWRKFIFDLLQSGVMVIDMFPYMRKEKGRSLLYGNDHRWSMQGAEFTAKHTAKVLRSVFPDLFRPADGTPGETREIGNEWAVSPATSECSAVAIFGNCNLLSLSHGEDRTFPRMLSEQLNTGLFDAGRILPFSGLESESFDNARNCQKFKNKRVAVYVGFPSASYVRGRKWSRYRLPVFAEVDWDALKSDFNLDRGLATYADGDLFKHIIPDGAPIAIWGAGIRCRMVLSGESVYSDEIKRKNIRCIVDTKVHGTSLGGYTIKPPSALADIDILHIVTFNQIPSEIIEQGRTNFKKKVIPIAGEYYQVDRDLFYRRNIAAEFTIRTHEQYLIDLIIHSFIYCDFRCSIDYLHEYKCYKYGTLRSIEALIEYVRTLLGKSGKEQDFE